MAGKDIIMISQEELKRLHLIHKALGREIKQGEAAEILSISDRQVRRLIKRVKEEGDGGIRHKSRGRPSNRRVAGEIKDKAINLYRKRYADFGPTLAAEKLLEIHKIKISDETLRKWLQESGDIKKTRKGRAHRKWRERKNHFGEMVQMDGSHHDWLEGRGDKSVLMGYIDDATNNIFARFYEYEGTIPAMDSFRHYIEKYGLPMSIYLDRHTTYKSTAKPTIEDEVNYPAPRAQGVFRQCVDRYNGNYKIKTFSCWDQFLCMAFAQLTYRESLRDIEACLRAAPTKLYHMGIRGNAARNTLAHANEVRDWRIYAYFAQTVLSACPQHIFNRLSAYFKRISLIFNKNLSIFHQHFHFFHPHLFQNHLLPPKQDAPLRTPHFFPHPTLSRKGRGNFKEDYSLK